MDSVDFHRAVVGLWTVSSEGRASEDEAAVGHVPEVGD